MCGRVYFALSPEGQAKTLLKRLKRSGEPQPHELTLKMVERLVDSFSWTAEDIENERRNISFGLAKAKVNHSILGLKYEVKD